MSSVKSIGRMTAGHKHASDPCPSAPESVNQKPEGAMYESHESENLGSAGLKLGTAHTVQRKMLNQMRMTALGLEALLF